MKRNTMATPEIKIHKQNHNHKYDTRSKRHCQLCSSIQGPIGVKENDIQNRERTQTTCSKRLAGRKSVRNKRVVASELPDELIYTIFLLIPVKLLHENMRFLNRVWRQTITSPCFITNHLQISSIRTHGLLVDHPRQQNVALYINPESQVTELPKPPFESRIKGSYHGLVLLHDQLNMDQFHVVNLVTKSIVSLPCFRLLSNLSPKHVALSLAGVAFSYASSINRYKIVIVVHPQDNKQLFQYSPPQVWVCTIGVDQNWRKLELQGIDEISGIISRITFHTPRSVGGIVYWSYRSYPNGCALDVDTETFYRFTMLPTPNTISEINDPNYWIICLQTGLGLVISYKLGVLWELYELTDLKSSKWTKIIDIDIDVIRSQIEKYYNTSGFWSLTPLVYTNDEKLWFHLSWDGKMFYYNLREENVIPVPVNGFDIFPYHHVNTLVALTNS